LYVSPACSVELYVGIKVLGSLKKEDPLEVQNYILNKNHSHFDVAGINRNYL